MLSYWELMSRAHEADIRTRRRRNKSQRDRNNAFGMSEAQFKKTYRLSKELARDLIEELAPFMPVPLRSDAIDLDTKILIALEFFATGSYQTIVGQCRYHCVSQATVSRAVRQVALAMNEPEVMAGHIVFPTTREAREGIKRDFYTSFHIPGVLGCIDGTHVAIVCPIENEERYFNRKGYHSLNMMIICDANLQILCVDPSNPGSTHDSRAWLYHPVKTHLEELYVQGEQLYLLGDSGYPLRPTMMTPILNAAPDTPESNFYDLHVTCRNVVERCIGVLKSWFRCLLAARTMHYDPVIAAKIANACCVLHNITHGAQLEVPLLTEEDEEEERRLQPNDRRPQPPVTNRQVQDLQEGRRVRETLVQQLWRARGRF